MGITELGNRLKQARERAKLTQLAVCDKVAISKAQTLSAYERGVNSPPLEILIKLAQLYKVSTDWLLFGTDNILQKEKTPMEYVEQLVDAVDHLGIPFDSWEDSFSHEDVIVLRLLSSSYAGLNSFIEKWSRLRDLLDNDTLEPDEYDSLIHQKLSALELTPPPSEEPKSSVWDSLPF